MLYQYSAKLQKVVDGDTVDLVVDLGFSINVTTRFRLDGIDAPEMKAPTWLKGNQPRNTWVFCLLMQTTASYTLIR